MNDSVYGIVNKPLVLPLTCRHCIHYRHIAAYSKPCSELGLLPESDPCRRFNVDIYQLDAVGDANLRNLLDLIGKVDKRVLPLIAGLCRQTTNKGNFHIGQEVVIQVFPGEYLNNYSEGVILSLTQISDGNEFQVVEKDGEYTSKHARITKDYALVQGKQGFRAMIYQSSIQSLEDWEKTRENLIKGNKINDPSRKVAVPTSDGTRRRRGRPPKNQTVVALLEKDAE